MIYLYSNKFDCLLLCKLMFKLKYFILESLAIVLALKDPPPTPLQNP